ncbi:Triple functional domain protein-like isoform X6 [Oopsacas minuta]|uniref:Triple functional domain protein-like isoform X6 n=1 Tax=Oopsacas minuta TaxID=111878 RepID=A0AAV7KKP0_9METZ|nr:Triple functional domain protein-like isoform X6 [Oopsacas minuta]
MAKKSDSNQNLEESIETSVFVRSFTRPSSSQSKHAVNSDTIQPVQDCKTLFLTNVAYLTGGRDTRGGAIIQINTPTIERSPDELANLLNFIASIPDDTIKMKGFSILIDCQSCPTHVAKFTVKVLQQLFNEKISTVFLLKPNNFWERRRSGMSFRSKSKYSFPVELLNSIKDIQHFFPDSTQYLPQHGGSLVYDHKAFTCSYLEFLSLIQDCQKSLSEYSDIYNIVQQQHLAANMAGAKKMLAEVEECENILKLETPKRLEAEATPLIHKIRAQASVSTGKGKNDRLHPDLLTTVSRLEDLVARLVTQQWHLKQHSQKRRAVLQDCFSHRNFENEVQQVLSWIHGEGHSHILKSNRIGSNHRNSVQLLEENAKFEARVKNWKQTVSETCVLGDMLVREAHYASIAINEKVQQVNSHWRSFEDVVNERTGILKLAMYFGQKSDQFFERCEKWQHACESENIPLDIKSGQELCRVHEDIKNIYENQFEQIEKDGNTLIEIMRKPKEMISSSSIPDYIIDIKRIREILFNLHDDKQHLDDLWKQRRQELTHTLQARIFQNDCDRITAWITAKGYNYLIKNSEIGNSYRETSHFLSLHQNFDREAKNQLTEGSALSRKSQDLISFHLPRDKGVTPHEIRKCIVTLEGRIQAFQESLLEREGILRNTQKFHETVDYTLQTYHKQIANSKNDSYPDSAQDTENLIKSVKQLHTFNIEELNRISHSCSKIQQSLENSSSRILEATSQKLSPDHQIVTSPLANQVDRVHKELRIVEEYFEKRLQLLDVCLNMRIFECDARTHLTRLTTWHKELIDQDIFPSTLQEAKLLVQKYQKRLNFLHQAFEIIHENADGLKIQVNMQQLYLVSSTPERVEAVQHVTNLTEDLERKQGEVLKIAADRVSQYQEYVILLEFELQYRELLDHITMIERTTPIEVGQSLEQSNNILKQIEQVDTELQNICQQVRQLQLRANQMSQEKHPSGGNIQYFAEDLTNNWNKVSASLDKRRHLVNVTCNFHELSNDLMRKFDELSRDFNTINFSDVSPDDRHLLKQNQENWKVIKEGVVLLNKDGQMLLQSLDQECKSQKFKVNKSHLKKPLSHEDQDAVTTLQLLKQRLNYILEMVNLKLSQADTDLWTQFEQKLSIISQIAEFQYESEEITKFLEYSGLARLKMHDNLKYNVKDCNTQLMKFKEDYTKIKRETSNRVFKCQDKGKRVQVYVADQFLIIQKIQVILNTLKNKWIQFQERCEAREKLLEKALLFQIDLSKVRDWRSKTSSFFTKIEGDLNASSTSDEVDGVISNLKECMQNSETMVEELLQQIKFLSSELGGEQIETQKHMVSFNYKMTKEELERHLANAENRKYLLWQIEREKNTELQLRKLRDMMIAELMSTERLYINDLAVIINKYVEQFPCESTPESIHHLKREIFSNITDIHLFHKNLFLPTLLDANNNVNEIADAFARFKHRIEELYTVFCRDRRESERILVAHTEFFEQWQQVVDEPLALLHQLLKPIQRITKYKLLLDKMFNVTQDLSEPRLSLKNACKAILHILNITNHQVDLLYLENFEGNVNDLGKLLHKGILYSSGKSWKNNSDKPRHTFLFTLALVLTKRQDDLSKEANSSLKYICKEVIFLDDLKLSMNSTECEGLKFILSSKDEKYYFRTNTMEAKEEWYHHLSCVLDCKSSLGVNKKPFFKPKSGFSKIINRSTSTMPFGSDSPHTSTPKTLLLPAFSHSASISSLTVANSSASFDGIPPPPMLDPTLHEIKIDLAGNSDFENSDSLNMNSLSKCIADYEPDSSNPRGIRLLCGDEVEILKRSINWSWVRISHKTNGSTGWVPTTHLSLSNGLTPESLPTSRSQDIHKKALDSSFELV